MKNVNSEKEKNPVRSGWDKIITCNPRMLSCIESAKIFAGSSDPVLICGETGTGKELFAEAIVQENRERKNNYVVQNCATIPENLFESILYGSTKGAFTGAVNKKGLLEIADGGVLFLDELNSMPFHLQPKLLRVIQDGKIRPIGSRTEKQVDVKIIAAMNQSPTELIKKMQLREDLFFRFSSGMIHLPPLRERKEDIPLYTEHFISMFNEKYHKSVKSVSEELETIFFQYHWPGNVRELKNVVDLCVRLSQGHILTEEHLPLYMEGVCFGSSEDRSSSAVSEGNTAEIPLEQPYRTLKETLEATEKECIRNALERCSGNITRAAELLGMPRQTLKFRMDKLHIENSWKQ